MLGKQSGSSEDMAGHTKVESIVASYENIFFTAFRLGVTNISGF